MHAQPPHFRVTSKRRDSTIPQHFCHSPSCDASHSQPCKPDTDTQRAEHFSRLPSPLRGSLKELAVFSLSRGCGACALYGSLLVLPHQIPTVAKVGYRHLYPHFRERKRRHTEVQGLPGQSSWVVNAIESRDPNPSALLLQNTCLGTAHPFALPLPAPP